MIQRLLTLCFSLLFISASGQWNPFRFAFISDTHIGSPNGTAEEDLRRTVADINRMDDIAFVVLTGDITELGTDEEIALAKRILDSLDVPWYIIPGNHDTGWSESGGVTFSRVFGYDRFHFEHNGIVFIGCASGPYVRMSDGHIPRDAVDWLDSLVKTTDPSKPIVFLNHYPLDKDLDNWYEVIDRLKTRNTLAALCGHGHANRRLDFEGIPAVMGRSNLRAKANYGGYNLVDIRTDSMVFRTRTPGVKTEGAWTGIALSKRDYDPGVKYPRPSYLMNDSFPQVRAVWTHSSDANVVSTPAVTKDLVVFGNSKGRVDALSLKDGKRKWSFATGGSIYSSPAVDGGLIVLGSGDGSVYALSLKDGRQVWRLQTGAAVLGSPVIRDGVVYIGGSDDRFRAVELKSGKELWAFAGLDGPVVGKPLVLADRVVFGAWDRHLYAVDRKEGRLLWKWNNGSPIRNYSPASCTPVVRDGVVYVVAPDRYLSAIDMETGATLWRTNESTVRESIGISSDGSLVYGKTMMDTVVAFPTSRTKQASAWKLPAGFGYEHTPSMLVEKGGLVHFGTRSGVVYAIDPANRRVAWKHKIDNSMVNTVNAFEERRLVAATMDGKVALLERLR